ncbi:DUF1918 domain-containing protein [Amycolatopsis sp. NPDC059657]|uniref:DUF1918 domain-containing protein n=1 Tax=Amycolatopsis sp. NPDC059657 TaxID=3346899 RepID=UPI003671C1AE
MKAQPGDWLVVKSPVIERPEQRAHILEVHSTDGSPPYLVKWTHDDHESLVFPGPDAIVLTESELLAADRAQRERITAMQHAIVSANGHG